MRGATPSRRRPTVSNFSYGAAPHDGDKTSVVEGSAERVLNAAVNHDVLASLGLTRN